ncbi:MSMEG_0570 family nitrogen starvation response protein [Pelomonas cellulosilytica]|uniref:MSMEG_0570 family nitrogen starvation response protein n=1 Tax=Pelomonas cellulosilytica TaxID=2906762 RepID=A0ABS8XTZ2_9BURK|nr:MSMEG_0570 family nitrogen starvation response protein [Pelomonas sp. P8]MCE4555338.1 MSMEG_0570 family nitrogen starvation response protein [Pelomonas sp. P8]
MPAIHYRLRWPDASETLSYSPSLAIQDFLEVGQDYVVDDFLRRVNEATRIANERVQAKFGFVCSRANDQLADTTKRAAAFAHQPDARIRVLGFSPA